jgi:mono/diheme cytochrome c family protein
MKVYRWLAAGFVALAPVVPPDGPAPQKPSPDPLAIGRKVYDREKCATCHQIARHGNSRFPLDGVGSKLTADQIRRWITHTAAMENALPKRPVIRMSEQTYRLSKTDLDALVAYLASLKK